MRTCAHARVSPGRAAARTIASSAAVKGLSVHTAKSLSATAGSGPWRRR
jgi:hypothetical protein